MKGVCVIVETRPIEDIRKIVDNHVSCSGFKPMIFHGAGNSQFVKEKLQGLGCTFFNIGIDELSAGGYNRLLTSTFFWKQIPQEKVLIFQHDSWMLRSGMEEFMEYDYVGALLYHIDFPCMNGGFSLRSKSKMIEAIEGVTYKGVANEDIYFCKRLEQMGAKLPTKEVAAKFCIETVPSLGSMAVHNFEYFHCKEIVNHVMNQYKNQHP